MKNRCIWVLNIGNYIPEISKITLHYLEKYAKRVNSDFNIIKTKKFNDTLVFEKMQIYDSKYEYNALIDLDIIINNKLPDCFERSVNNKNVLCYETFNAFNYFKIDSSYQNETIFNVNGNKVLAFPSASFIVTNQFNHEIWKENLEIYSFEDMKKLSSIEWMIDEWNIAFNMRKLSLKFEYLFNESEKLNLLHLASKSINNKNQLKVLNDFILMNKILKFL